MARHFRSFRRTAPVALLVPLALAVAPASAAAPASATTTDLPRVVIAMLPSGTKPADLAAVPGLSPGVMSAGLGRVISEQTYLDITQGNRVFSGFYDRFLPFLLPLDGKIDGWNVAVRRADSAPAEIVPGLLASTLNDAGRSARLRGLTVRTDPVLLAPAVIAADVAGNYKVAKQSCGFSVRCPPGVSVVGAYADGLRKMVSRLRGRDMLIAIERAPPSLHHGLSIGIAGAGFDGNLISDSTRLGGVVLSSDVAPTVLQRYGIPLPGAMTGRPIRTEGEIDGEEVVQIDERMSVIAPRRGYVIGKTLEAWVLAVALAALLFRRRGARTALAMFAISCMYLPAILLLGAALEPMREVERGIVAIGAPLLAAITLRAFRGYTALAVACAVTVGAYAADVIAGSKLTPLSLMGSNPALGVRFYGIGNELEATLTAMTLVGIGSALAGRGSMPAPRTQAKWFLGLAAALTVIFAFGRFGADVGAAIVLPVGAATAALYALGIRGTRFVLIVVLAPLAGVAALVALDLLLGGNSHLSRSVLHANDTQSLGDIASRRLRSSVGSFQHPGTGSNGPLLLLAFALLGSGLLLRRRIRGWFGDRSPAVAGLLGATIATFVGALANDSGALILMLGTGVLFLTVCFALSQSLRAEPAKSANSAET